MQNTKNVWIVCRINWEYDDSTYYSRDDAGFPEVAYDSYEKAKELATQYDYDFLREYVDELESYYYDYDGLPGILTSIFGSERLKGIETQIPEDATDDELDKVLEACGLSFFSVHKCELNEFVPDPLPVVATDKPRKLIRT